MTKAPSGRVFSTAESEGVVAAGVLAVEPHQSSTYRPDDHDIELAARAVRLHCVSRWPDGDRCLNCGWAFPCVSHQWGREVLRAARWSDREIAALDARRGPWS